jgi:pSer/pThr/pTyr-binding forkhead associated (FHA) protein
MNLRLIVETGARRGVFPLRSSIAVIGRGRGNAVRIPSADVSRRHCRLTTQDGRLWVEDLGSVNGTLLNGERIAGIEWVRPGDNLTVGPVTFVVEYETGDEEILDAEQIEIEPIEEILPLDEDDEDLPLAVEEDLLPSGFEPDEEADWSPGAFRDMVDDSED